MISEKAIEYAQRIDALAEKEFGEAYTLTATYWNDGDFRLVAYCAKNVPAEALPGDTPKVFAEFAYQDSRMPDDLVVRGSTAQDSDGPRSEAEQYSVGEPDLVELPV